MPTAEAKAAPAATPTAADQPTEPPSDAPTEEAAATPEPTATSAAPPPFAPGDADQFRAYVQSQYSALGSRQLTITAVTFAEAASGAPLVQVEIDARQDWNALSEQDSAANAYMARLLADAKYYFVGQPCQAALVAEYDTPALDQCAANAGRCSVNGFISEEEGWSVSWIYVAGVFDGESDSIDVASPHT